MDIPSYLREQVTNGKAVLFLGAGFSQGATDPKGAQPPTASQLARHLSQTYLSGQHATDPLHTVAELAIAASDLFTVQDYIKHLLDPYRPAEFHKIVPLVHWRCVATTNYDRILERAYEEQRSRVQQLRPFIADGDRIEEQIASLRDLILLKLHGCITRTHDTHVPLVLTPQNYITSSQGRTRLVSRLRELAFEHTFIFVGHSLSDIDLRQMFADLATAAQSRPRFFAIAPDFSSYQSAFWEKQNVTLIAGTAADFLISLDKALSSPFRPVVRPKLVHEILTDMAPHATVSQELQDYLAADLLYVKAGVPTSDLDPRDFYRGMDPDWTAIQSNYDFPRPLADRILEDFFMEDIQAPPRLHVIKGYAGAGKTVLLKRLALRAVREFECFCLFVSRDSVLRVHILAEICAQLRDHRLFLIVDDAAEHARQLTEFLQSAHAKSWRVSVLTAERVNEWNVGCARLEEYVTGACELDALSDREIDLLLALLNAHDSLGSLQGLTPDRQRDAFRRVFDGQLLVALHEATLGRPFQDIVADEYEEVSPPEAQQLYLAVCSLNRFDVPVRAGVISRLFALSMADFRSRFFKPLEHVVYAHLHPRLNDYVYRTRHPIIARLVYERALPDPSKRLEWHTRLLRYLDIDYQSDMTAFRQMVKYSNVRESFGSDEAVQAVLQVALDMAADLAFVHHQAGLFEMNRGAPNWDAAHKRLAQAQTLAPRDGTIKHSTAELALRRSQASDNPVVKAKYRADCRKLVRQLIEDPGDTTYAFHTLAKLELDILEEALGLSGTDISDAALAPLIANVESAIHRGLQRSPDDLYIMEADAQLARLLKDRDRCLRSLEQAFRTNPQSEYIALRLARHYEDEGNIPEARSVLDQSVSANPSGRATNYAYARFLIRRRPGEGAFIERRLMWAFTKGDSNYEAQFWYARQLYINGKTSESRACFQQLKRAPVDPARRASCRAPIEDADGPVVFSGHLQPGRGSSSIIVLDGSGDTVYWDGSSRSSDSGSPSHISRGTRLCFSIAFNFHGPTAVDVRPERPQ